MDMVLLKFALNFLKQNKERDEDETVLGDMNFDGLDTCDLSDEEICARAESKIEQEILNIELLSEREKQEED